MFDSAVAYNKALKLNTGKVTDMSFMFRNAYSFNQDLYMDTRRVASFAGMFDRAIHFQGNISSFTMTNAKTAMGMFQGAGIHQNLCFLARGSNPCWLCYDEHLSTIKSDVLRELIPTSTNPYRVPSAFHVWRQKSPPGAPAVLPHNLTLLPLHNLTLFPPYNQAAAKMVVAHMTSSTVLTGAATRSRRVGFVLRMTTTSG